MIKNIAIVSLSAGTIGEPFVKHELDIGVRRLEEMGLSVRFMPNALKGRAFIAGHPEARAADLLAAFADPDIDMILCAIGGDDTYRLLPYLFDNGELEKAVSNKLFLGFSDTTINHFMLRKVGLDTFYGQSFLADICELESDMLPYTKRSFTELIETGTISEIRPSDRWYEGREDFGPDQIGVPLVSHPDRGFELLQGAPVFSGEILGGCIDSIYDMFASEKYPDMPILSEKYGLFPKKEEWRGKILLLESSEVKMPPERYALALAALKERGVFNEVSGVLVGKPMDETYESEYKRALVSVIDDPTRPRVCNINIGHAQPRCIIPLGVPATVDVTAQVIRFGGSGGEITVRFAARDELESVNMLRRQVQALHAAGRPELFRPGFPDELRDHVYALFDDPSKRIVVAERGGAVCGYAVLNRVIKPENPYMCVRDHLDIDEFCVDAACRRQGVGSEIMRFIRAYAKEQGVGRIELNMWEFNREALAFYEAAGFSTYRRNMELKL